MSRKQKSANGEKKQRFTRLGGKNRRREFIAFDIETNTEKNIGRFLFGGVFNGEQYLHFTDREKMLKFVTLNRFAGIVFCAHNLEYDLNRIFLHDKNLIRFYLGSRLIFAEYPVKGGKITFWDTSALSNYSSLKSLGDKFDLPKLEAKFEDKVTPSFVKYNRRDCEICYKFADTFQDMMQSYNGTMRGTAAGNSFDIYRRNFMPEIAEYFEIPQSIIGDFREAYYGGRVEVFNFNKYKKVNYFDINSSYPAAMLKNFPLLNTWKNKANIEKDGVTFCRVTVPEMSYQPLPVKRGKLLFPYGTWQGFYFNNEIRGVLERCPGVKIEPIRGTHYKKSAPIFADYIEFMYQKRKKAKDEIEKMLYKFLMNSLYGRFGLSSELEKIQGDNREIVEGKKVFANVIWAGMITAYARLALYDLITKTQSIYCDTDSSITTGTLETSKELGGISLKGQFKDFEAKGNKIYFYRDGKKIVRVLKGISPDADEISPGVFRETRPIKYKSALRRKIDISSWISVEKRISFSYDKRVVNNDGTTRPVFIKE